MPSLTSARGICMRITDPYSTTLCSERISSCIASKAISCAGVSIGTGAGAGCAVSSASSDSEIASAGAGACAAGTGDADGAMALISGVVSSACIAASAGSFCVCSAWTVATGANSIASAGAGVEQALKRRKHNMSSIPCNNFNAFTTSLVSITRRRPALSGRNDRIRLSLRIVYHAFTMGDYEFTVKPLHTAISRQP